MSASVTDGIGAKIENQFGEMCASMDQGTNTVFSRVIYEVGVSSVDVQLVREGLELPPEGKSIKYSAAVLISFSVADDDSDDDYDVAKAVSDYFLGRAIPSAMGTSEMQFGQVMVNGKAIIGDKV